MIMKIGQVMLYVDDVAAVKQFWTEKAGFVVVEEKEDSVEIAPSKDAQTSLVLFNRKEVEALEPELNFETPSIMFETEDAKKLYQQFKDASIAVGELVTIEMGTVFNFADVEGNYFAVVERN